MTLSPYLAQKILNTGPRVRIRTSLDEDERRPRCLRRERGQIEEFWAGERLPEEAPLVSQLFFLPRVRFRGKRSDLRHRVS